MSQMMKANNTRSSYNDPSFTPFQSGCSLCYPSTDYQFTNTMNGGSQQKLISNLPGKNLYKTTNYSVPMNKLMKDNYGISFNTSGGAKKSKHSLEKKVSHMMKYVNKRGGAHCDGVHSEDSTMSGGKKTHGRSASRGRSTKKKGGMGAEMMPSEEHHSSMKMGGAKKTRGRSASRGRSTKKKGGMAAEMMTSEEHHSTMMKTGGKKTGAKKTRGRSASRGRSTKKKGGMATQMMTSEENHSTMMKTGGAKKTRSRKTKSRSRSASRGRKLKGGEETWGATGMPSQFFNVNAKLVGYPYKSGMGAKTAYGPANPQDVGMGLLAPNTTSRSSTANPATSMKTGGRKKIRKQSGKGFPIPSLSSIPIDTVQVNVDKGINDVQSFLKDLKKDYVKSVQKAASIKIGNQRLIQGGAKSRTTKKKDAKKITKKTEKKDTKKVVKKSMKKDTKKIVKKSMNKDTKKKVIKKKKGGNGSDFISTFNSRGPSNAPDNYWGVNGEKWFRQFNKTANYIPNSQLAKAATPKLLAGPMNEKVVGYNSFESTFSPIRGGKKTVAKKKKVVKKDTKKSTKKDTKKSTKKDTKKSTKKEKKDTKKKKTSKK